MTQSIPRAVTHANINSGLGPNSLPGEPSTYLREPLIATLYDPYSNNGANDVQVQRSIFVSIPGNLRTKIERMPRKWNWNGEKAKAITRRACEEALGFLQNSVCISPGLPWPSASPSVRGAVALNWTNEAEDKYIMIQFMSRDTSSIYYQIEGPENFREQGRATRDQVIQKLHDVFSV